MLNYGTACSGKGEKKKTTKKKSENIKHKQTKRGSPQLSAVRNRNCKVQLVYSLTKTMLLYKAKAISFKCTLLNFIYKYHTLSKHRLFKMVVFHLHKTVHTNISKRGLYVLYAFASYVLRN